MTDTEPAADGLLAACHSEMTGMYKLVVDGGHGSGGWSITAGQDGYMGVGPKGFTLPPGSVIRAIEGGFRIEGPKYLEDQACRPRIGLARQVTVAALIRARLLRAFRRNHAAPEREPTVFIRGDATGAVIGDIETDADIFIGGDRTNSVIANVVHRTRQKRS